MMRYVGGIIGAGVLGGILTRGDTLTIDTVRIIFGFVLVATLLATFSATLIHRFAGEMQRARELALSAELTASGGQ
jgi:phosphate/sulfate permease